MFDLIAVTAVDSGIKALEVLGLNEEKVESPSVNVSQLYTICFLKFFASLHASLINIFCFLLFISFDFPFF